MRVCLVGASPRRSSRGTPSSAGKTAAGTLHKFTRICSSSRGRDTGGCRWFFRIGLNVVVLCGCLTKRQHTVTFHFLHGFHLIDKLGGPSSTTAVTPRGTSLASVTPVASRAVPTQRTAASIPALVFKPRHDTLLVIVRQLLILRNAGVTSRSLRRRHDNNNNNCANPATKCPSLTKVRYTRKWVGFVGMVVPQKR